MVSGPGRPNLLEIEVVDPDVDDSGLVDFNDLLLIEAAKDASVGQPRFEARLDLNGNGRVRGNDVSIAAKSFGETVPVP
jgi:hypothetical protein